MSDDIDTLRKHLSSAIEFGGQMRAARDRARLQRDRARRDLALAQAENERLRREVGVVRAAVIEIGEKIIERSLQ